MAETVGRCRVLPLSRQEHIQTHVSLYFASPDLHVIAAPDVPTEVYGLPKVCGHPRSFLGVCQAPVLSEYLGALYVEGDLSGAIIVSEWSGAFCLVLERKDLEFLSRTELSACELDSLPRAVEGWVVCVISL